MKKIIALFVAVATLGVVSAVAQDVTPDHIVISKQTHTLTLYGSDGSVLATYPVATGKNPGNKRVAGDMKTPEGEFIVTQVQRATHWTHDLGDGNGRIDGYYGNWFIRLDTRPHTGMGIHGTHTPECIGTRSTEGCIRMRNEDLDALHALVKEGMRVIIEPGDADKATDLREGEMPEEVKAAERERLAEQTVVVEEKRQEEAKAKEVWHTVKDGDLVGAIARKYGTTVNKIKELNPSLNVDRISINQRIRVK